VNFIGHALVAGWRRSEPRFVLGSMLPDFAGMAGTRLRRATAAHDTRAPAETTASGDTTGRGDTTAFGDTSRDLVAAGIALHHQTDDVFHGAPAFTTLLQEALDTLSADGVPRGTARAVGHIGVEMLIDGELLHDAALAQAYSRAIAVESPLDALFIDAEGAVRWARLRERLLAYGVPHDYRDPDSVLRRLQVVLRGRPRLAIDAEAAPRVRAYLPALQRKVVTALPALLSSLREGLRAELA